MSDDLEERLEYLRDWHWHHGPHIFDNADDWINSMSNVELLTALSWAKQEKAQ